MKITLLRIISVVATAAAQQEDCHRAEVGPLFFRDGENRPPFSYLGGNLIRFAERRSSGIQEEENAGGGVAF